MIILFKHSGDFGECHRNFVPAHMKKHSLGGEWPQTI
jgi:hypothetical protein